MNEHLAIYKSTDYYFLFQTTGVSLLFSDLCARYYSEFNSIVVSTNGQYRYYVHNDDLIKAKTSYDIFYKTAGSVNEFCSRFETADEQLSTLKDEISQSRKVGVGEFDTFTSYAAIVLNEYSKFDHVYTDYLFKDERPDIEDLKSLVMEKKNVFRERINDIFFNEDSCMMTLLGIVSKYTGVSINALLYSSAEGVRSLVLGEPEDISVQGSDYAIIRDNELYVVLKGLESSEFIKHFLVSEDLSQVQELKGVSVAKKGVYKGLVKKVSIDYTALKESIAKLDQVGEGLILVTDSTVPEMLSVMKRSLAIVTDMGGILSHAAISSRELGIPCVVGTKDATRVLNDGELVEVDANTGIIKILT